MALSEDQRAMLQLLLERGQSYADIGSLLGLGTDEVRARARAALTEMGGEDPDRQVGLTDYLLGQADPIGRADAVRHLGADAEDHALASKLLAQLRLVAPEAELPELPAQRGRSAPRGQPARPAPAAGGVGPPDATAARPGFFESLSQRQRQLIAALLAGGIVAIAAVLAIAGVFNGGDSDEPSTTAQSTNPETVTRAILEPPNGGRARGVAIFGRVQNQPVLQISVAGLRPSPEGRSYVVWLTGPADATEAGRGCSGDLCAFPLSRETVGKKGTVNGLAPLPTQLITFLQRCRTPGNPRGCETFDAIEVSLADDADVQDALRVAQQRTRFPEYVGETALSGEVVGPGFGAATNAGVDSGGGSSGG
jgi:hypothetical protein